MSDGIICNKVKWRHEYSGPVWSIFNYKMKDHDHGNKIVSADTAQYQKINHGLVFEPYIW